MADPKDAMMPAAQYFNMARVSHSNREFFLDFGQHTGDEVAALIARLVATPSVAKAVLDVLEKNIRRYESLYGTITDPRPVTEAEGDIQ